MTSCVTLHPVFTKMNNKTIVLKQQNPPTRDKFQDPIALLFGRHKCKCIIQMKDGHSFINFMKSAYS